MTVLKKKINLGALIGATVAGGFLLCEFGEQSLVDNLVE